MTGQSFLDRGNGQESATEAARKEQGESSGRKAFFEDERKLRAKTRRAVRAHGPGNGTLGVSSPGPALCAGWRLFRDTASKNPVFVVFASTNKVTQLTTNGTDNRVHNVVPSFIIIKRMGIQRHTQIVDP